MFFVTLMQHLNHLRGGKLEDNGLQCSVPAEKEPGDNQDHGVDEQNIIPGIVPGTFGNGDGDEIRSAAAGISYETKTGRQTVDQPAKNTDQQSIIGDWLDRDDVCQKTGQENYTAGADGKTFADKF